MKVSVMNFEALKRLEASKDTVKKKLISIFKL